MHFPSGHEIWVLQTPIYHSCFKPSTKHLAMPLFLLGKSFPKAVRIYFFVLAYDHLYLYRKRLNSSLLTKSIKIIQNVNILFFYLKNVRPRFHIQHYHYVKKFQIATKNIVSPSKVSFPYNCKNSNGKKKITPKSDFSMSCCTTYFFKLAKDTIN